MSDKFFCEISSLSLDGDVSRALKFTTFSPAELRVAVVDRTQLNLLDPEWSSSGIYILLDNPRSDGNWTGYVGKSAADRGVRGRLSNHLSKKSWARALAVCPKGQHWDEAEVAWLEFCLYALLLNSSNVDITNSQPVGEGKLSEVRQMRISKVPQTIANVLSVIGHGVKSADFGCHQEQEQSPDRARLRGVTIKAMIDKNLLVAGDLLTPVDPRWQGHVTVLKDGNLQAPTGETHGSPSGAAKSLTTRVAERGWSFWRLSSGTTLSELRKQYLQMAEN